MRVVVTGASGNVGSSVVEALGRDARVSAIVGVCRRPHEWRPARTEWVWADVASDDLDPVFSGADAVIHLAWLFQPMRRPEVTWQANVIGSQRVLEAAARSEVGTLVVASSVGAYSGRQDLEPVREDWPTNGVPVAAYSREKAYVERLLDQHELRHPERRVVRMRPAFIFHEHSRIQQRRLFAGPFVPELLLRPGRLPVLPLPTDLRLQAVHTEDVATAYVSAVTRDVAGAFNLAADPVLGPADLARVLKSRWQPVPARLLRNATSAAFHARAIPTAPELFDLLMQVPMMSSERARAELEWRPAYTVEEALSAFLEGDGEARPSTPPLARRTSGPLRSHELGTGLGSRP